MLKEDAKVAVVVRSKLLKFAEGQDPTKDEPFEVVEREHTLEGPEAEALLMTLGKVDPSEVVRRSTNKQEGK